MESQINGSRLREAAKHYLERLETEKLLAIRVQFCMEIAEKLCMQIADTVGPNLIRCRTSDGVVILVTRERVLTLAAAGGAASDARLRRPQGLLCRQVLIFGHLDGEEAGTLISAFRIYPDGTCSDGESEWKLDNKDNRLFGKYLSELVASNLLDFDVFWPPTEEFPESVKKIAMQGNKPEPVQLKNACIGFDCPIPT